MLEGLHAIKHAIRFGAKIDLVVTCDRDALTSLARDLAPDVLPALRELATTVPRAEFAALSNNPVDTGVIAVARRRIASVADLDARAPVVLLESPAHSGNVGAVVRVAAAFGAAGVVTTGVHDPWNAGAIRGSAGLHYALPVLCADASAITGRPLIAIDPEGDDLRLGAIPCDAILAFGSERAGLSQPMLEQAERRIRIPMRAGVSSLNLATAVAVVLQTWTLDA